MAGLCEDFLARDEVRFLGLCFTFHVLPASIALLSCYKYPELWALAEEDLSTLARAQDEMKKKWPSALVSIGTFDRMLKLAVATRKQVIELPKSTLTPGQAVFFEDCDMTLCRMHDVLVRKTECYSGGEPRDYDPRTSRKSHPPMNMNGDGYGHTVGGSGNARYENTNVNANGNVHFNDEVTLMPQHNQGDMTFGQQPLLAQSAAPDESINFEQMFQEEAEQLNGATGDWLFWDRLAFNAN